MAEAEPMEPGFAELLAHVQNSRGLDFRGYKKTSLRRRILRRMEEVGVEGFEAYQAFLEAHPQEFVGLLNTVLINVTSFFRDAEAWEALRAEAIPSLIEGTRPIRIWSAGCATGQEPYSLAILLMEALGSEAFGARVKIYATDLDEEALRFARLATYSARDVEAVPPELLERHFDNARDSYTVSRELRKAVIFGQHNIVTDAPISRINLLSCRNLLIYLEGETQERVLERLHYALAEDGLLFLGKAETQMARSRLFQPVNLKHRLFRRPPQQWRRTVTGGAVFQGRPPPPLQHHARLVEAIADRSPTAFLAVDDQGVLAYVNAAARRLLDVTEDDLGRPFQDLSVSYRPVELRSQIEEASRQGRAIRIENQLHDRPGGTQLFLTVEVMPLEGGEDRRRASLIAFTDVTHMQNLQRELKAVQESLETTVEELQSANEELETTNEELQSTNEELETTNEELQSTNEELETTNEELRSTNDALEAANEELRLEEERSGEYRRRTDALLARIEAGLLTLDRQLRVESWNRWSENTWGLRAEEVRGQEFLDLDIGLPVKRLQDSLLSVLAGKAVQAEETLEARDRRGRALFCRIRIMQRHKDGAGPEGLILIVEDVTEASRAQEEAQLLSRMLGRALPQSYLLDPQTLRVILASQGSEEGSGYSPSELRGLSLPELVSGATAASLHDLLRPLFKGERQEVVLEAMMRAKHGAEHPAEFRIRYIPEETPPVLVALVNGISERVRLPPSG
ncbi:CheR family methyltransferase [Sabulicella rubraurantiaca]|uniref:CheR family methyltransferase n=1 Tax=Sabulicella rubraurantiaca TaxID=2811429 RepID=UPI001F178BBC|nr:CheR family methyltransferase [Sabulicella rubraurantiaca]